MKKALILSLVAAFTLSASSAVAQANPAADTEKAGKVTTFTTITRAGNAGDIAAFKQMPDEITGEIQEISENEMKVKAQDGEVYLIPLGLFSKEEGFKELGLAKGINVTLKSIRSQMPDTLAINAEAGEAVAVAGTDAVKPDTGKVTAKRIEAVKTEAGDVIFSIKDGEGVSPDEKTVEIKELQKVFIAGEITANGKTVKIDVKASQLTMAKPVQIQPQEISGTVQSISENDMTVKTKDEKIYLVPLSKFNSLQEFKALDLKEGTEVELKSGDVIFASTVTIKNTTGDETASFETAPDGEAIKTLPAQKSFTAVKNADGTVTVKSVDGKDIKTIDIQELKSGKLVFSAAEITANGKTVKLQK